jgi:hypothetical protein
MKLMGWLSYLLIGLLVLFILIVLLLLSAAVTGRDSRSYNTLAATEIVQVGDQSLSMAELAAKYSPEFLLHRANPSPPLLWTWYEAIPTEKTIDIVYYAVWENEVNPDPRIDKAYALFRAAYYGYPIRDIEFMQISVDRQSGEVVGLLFETSPGEDYFVTISEHITARYTIQKDGTFLETLKNRDDEQVSQQPGIQVIFRENHPQIYVQTWNHLSRLLRQDDTNVEKISSELKYLSAQEYSQYKFSRKSQGDHKTVANPISLLVAFICILVFVQIPAAILLLLRRWVKKMGQG